MKYLLSIFLIVVFIKQLVWVAFVPIWQTPDEQAHFAQVAIVAEKNKAYLPGVPNTSEEIFTSEVLLGTKRDSFGNNKFTYRPTYNLPYSESVIGPDEEKLINIPTTSRSKFVISEATSYPPAYYFLASSFYKVFNSGSLFDRVFAVRIFSALLLTVLAYISFRIGKLIFSSDLLAMTLSVMVSFHPMVSFVFTGVTSDTLFNLLVSTIIFLGLHIFYKRDSKSLLILLPVVLLTIITKPQSAIVGILLLPVAIFVLWRFFRKKYVLIPMLITIAIGFWGIFDRIIRGESIFPETEQAVTLASFVNLPQFLVFTLNHTYKEVLPWYWGVFRWLSLGLPDWLRRLTNIFTIVSLLSFLLFLLVSFVRKNFSKQFFTSIFLLYCLIVYFSALTLFDFGFFIKKSFSFGIQGRYFFPVLPAQMVLSIVGLTFMLNRKLKHIASLAMIFLFLSLNAYVLLYLLSSYYTLSFPQFFIEASQYKPYWLKFPANLLMVGIHLITVVVFAGLMFKSVVAQLAGRYHNSGDNNDYS